ncbi:MAG: hypothetical protein HY744_02950 [Deltaproteobacteria bacterium]|nr:hypothetical protein [Deltaproteobacteria bacterium]
MAQSVLPVLLVALAAVGCDRCPAPVPSTPGPRLPVPVASPAAIVSVAAAPAAAGTSAPSAAPASAAARAAPTWRGEYCTSDEQCAWDDPCQKWRCVAAGEAAAPRACAGEPARAATCACVESMCTRRPADLASGASAASGCTGDEQCAVDVASGTCHLGGETLIGPIHEQGPVCTCNRGSGRCELLWSGPVPCRSWRDCSWVRHPRLRPVPATVVPRPVPRQVRPCRDGEIDSLCVGQGTDKLCRIEGWSC